MGSVMKKIFILFLFLLTNILAAVSQNGSPLNGIYRGENLIVNNPFDPATWASGISFINSDETTAVTPKLTVTYDQSDDMTLYGSIGGGYRGGGLNRTGVTPNAYDEEKVLSYEFGSKGLYMDRRVTANAAIFYNDWQDKQVSALTNDLVPEVVVTNVGAAHTLGVELEITAKLTDQWELGFATNWVDASIDEDSIYRSEQLRADGAADTVAIAEDGNRLPLVPEHSAHISLQYEWSIGDLIGRARGAYSIISDSYNTLGEEDITRASSYSTADLSISINADEWDVKLYCQNCTDKVATNYYDLNAAATDIGTQFVPITPRTIGLTLSYWFN